jgi:hypothetical protein
MLNLFQTGFVYEPPNSFGGGGLPDSSSWTIVELQQAHIVKRRKQMQEGTL